ncbi:hypothetical protein N7510_001471 [Penicillium lagena]|uniref:uncharacterized protein n=1 Tax=Penicillium lagena TaxID=94218 RepID=UPI002542396A|nr:uncharacterized protein N7510_001471 [Penicillium lagena]KAJ5625162.1 hypothetical protein N7510_001471 [Penicillium lagena]
MSTDPPRTPDHSVLGDSWVVASTSSLKEQGAQNATPASPSTATHNKERNKDGTTPKTRTGSPAAFSSAAMSGPELIMPSIYEVAISEASWVAPGVRAKEQPSSLRKRHKVSSSGAESPQKQLQPSASARSSDAGTSAPAQGRHMGLVTRLIALCRQLPSSVRMTINVVLLTLVLHLLVFPELVYQVRDLCKISAVATLYSNSCTSPDPIFFPPSNPFQSPEEALATSQKRLESIFDTTLETLTPHATIIKQSESTLRNLQDQVKAVFPGAKHALDLEFQGSDQAVRAAAWEFDSLRADLRSAVDSLLASPPTLESGGSIARDTRLVTQLRRKEQYLDRLRAQILTKADSLASRLATLDDHLEAIEGIVTREQRTAILHPSTDGSGNLLGPLNSIMDTLHGSSLGAFFVRGSMSSSPDSASSPSPLTIRQLLRQALVLHRPIADSVQRLSRQLRAGSRRQSEPTW